MHHERGIMDILNIVDNANENIYDNNAMIPEYEDALLTLLESNNEADEYLSAITLLDTFTSESDNNSESVFKKIKEFFKRFFKNFIDFLKSVIHKFFENAQEKKIDEVKAKLLKGLQNIPNDVTISIKSYKLNPISEIKEDLKKINEFSKYEKEFSAIISMELSSVDKLKDFFGFKTKIQSKADDIKKMAYASFGAPVDGSSEISKVLDNKYYTDGKPMIIEDSPKKIISKVDDYLMFTYQAVRLFEEDMSNRLKSIKTTESEISKNLDNLERTHDLDETVKHRIITLVFKEYRDVVKLELNAITKIISIFRSVRVDVNNSYKAIVKYGK